MGLKVKFRGYVAAMAVCAIPLFAAPPSYAATGEEVIAARIKFMRDEMNALWRPIGTYGKSGTGSLADVEKNALAIAKLAEKIPDHFPKDTGRGKFPDKMTRSVPLIWTDWDGFNKEVKSLIAGSEKLAKLAKDGDKDGVAALIGNTGSYNRTGVGCQGCHDKFWGPRVTE